MFLIDAVWCFVVDHRFRPLSRPSTLHYYISWNIPIVPSAIEISPPIGITSRYHDTNTMADDKADFLDYIDALQKEERIQQHEALAAQLRKQWRETTWAGALIATIERIGADRFFYAVGSSFEGGQDTASFWLTGLLYKIGYIASAIFFVYVIGKVLKVVMGEEIVIEQEIVIVEEVTRSQV